MIAKTNRALMVAALLSAMALFHEYLLRKTSA